MPRNIELKAQVADLSAAHNAAGILGAELHSVERQRDTYFRVVRGRLKLRQRWVEGKPVAAELIFYERPDTVAAKASQYTVVPIPHGDALLQSLSDALGVLVEVDKQRTVYLHDNVRIHLDAVERLGTFVEFEAIVDSRCDDQQARAKVDALQKHFELQEERLLQRSYSDMLLDG